MKLSQQWKPLANNKKAGAKSAKIDLRRKVAAAIGGPVHVFDAFAGAGSLYRETWKHLAASYVGCDKKYYADERRVFVADNRRVLRAIDLAPFTLFDLDAYGDPWEQAIIIAARRPIKNGERVGFVVTEAGLHLKNGVVPHAIRELTGLRHRGTPGAALFQRRAEMHSKIWRELARRMGARVERMWKADARGNVAMVYMGAVLIGEPPAVKDAAGQQKVPEQPFFHI
jgi:hypothetical protein